jgi:hypothetical protein
MPILSFVSFTFRKEKESVVGRATGVSPFFSGEFFNPLAFSDSLFTFSGQIHSGFVQSVL